MKSYKTIPFPCSSSVFKWVLLFFLLPVQAYCDLILVENKIPKSEIVIGASPTRSAQFAALELQYGIKLITGAEIPIVAAPKNSDTVQIMVGIPADGETFKHEEYSIRFREKKIYLAGNDTPDFKKVNYTKTDTFPPLQYYYRASCFAVYDFLEKACGIRYYSYGDTGTAFTPRKTLSVSNLDYRRAPAMKAFRVPYFEGPQSHIPPRDLLLLRHRWRENIVCGLVNHNIYSIYYRYWGKATNKQLASVFIEHRPEYFAQRSEDRRSSRIAQRYYAGQYVPSQLCYAVDGPVNYFADEANKVYQGKKVPGVRFPDLKKLPDTPFYYPIQPDDDTSVCQCSQCKEKMEKDRSAYLFSWINKVAAKAHKLNPDINFATLAYDITSTRPADIELYPELSVQICMDIALWFHPLIYKRQHGIYKDWVRHEGKKRMLSCWLYMLDPGSAIRQIPGRPGFFPVIYPKRTGKIITEFLDDGLQGLFAEIYIKQHEVESYIMSRLIYDNSIGYEELLNEYYNLYYGNAGKAMKQVFEKIETVSTDIKNYPATFQAKDKVNSSYVMGMYDEATLWQVGTPQRIAAIDKLLIQAQKAARTPIEKARIKRFISNLWEPVKSGRAAFDRRQKFNAANIPTLEFVAPVQEYNGDLDKADFKHAYTFNDWKSAYGKPVKVPATLKLFTDSTHLYIDYKETGAEPYQKRKLKFWSNGFEIFLGADKSQNFKQIFTSVNGKYELYTHAITEGVRHFKKQNITLPVKNSLTPEGWHLQMAVPLSILGKQLKKQKYFCGNFIRTKMFKPTKNTSLYFSPIFTPSHQSGIDRMGVFYLPPPIPQESKMVDISHFLPQKKNKKLPVGWINSWSSKPVTEVKNGRFILKGKNKAGSAYFEKYTPLRPGDTVEFQLTAAGKNADCVIVLTNGTGRYVTSIRKQLTLSEKATLQTVIFKVPEAQINKRPPTYARPGFRVANNGMLELSGMKVTVKRD